MGKVISGKHMGLCPIGTIVIDGGAGPYARSRLNYWNNKTREQEAAGVLEDEGTLAPDSVEYCGKMTDMFYKFLEFGGEFKEFFPTLDCGHEHFGVVGADGIKQSVVVNFYDTKESFEKKSKEGYNQFLGQMAGMFLEFGNVRICNDKPPGYFKHADATFSKEDVDVRNYLKEEMGHKHASKEDIEKLKLQRVLMEKTLVNTEGNGGGC